MPINWSIRHYLIVLILAMALPWVGQLIYSLERNYANALEAEGVAAQRLAETAAIDTQRYLGDTHQFLEGLAKRPQTSALDPAACDPMLVEIKALFPQYANLAVTDRSGQILCSALRPNAKNLPSVGALPWFQDARATNRPHVGAVHKGPVSGKWVSVVSAPIPDGNGEFNGLIGYSLDLAKHPLPIGAVGLPSGMSISIVTADGRIVMTTVDGIANVGEIHPDIEAVNEAFASPTGHTLLGTGDRQRLLAHTPIKGTDWEVIAVRPADQVLRGLWLEANKQYIGAMVLILLGALLAFYVGRHIIRPITHIAHAARSIATGEFSVRAKAGGPREIAAVADHFNRMVEVRLKAEARFRDLLEAASDGILLVDRNGLIVLANNQAEVTFGYAHGELHGMAVHALVPEPQRTNHAKYLDAYFQHPTRRQMGRIVSGLRKDGRMFPCDIGLSPLNTDDGLMVSAIVHDLTERTNLEEQIAFLAQHDALTGLPNRALLRDRLEQAAARADRDQTRVALVAMDLDRFGELNDFQGTAVADRVLKECASRIRCSLRDADSVVRSGSDEFIALIEDIAADNVALHFVDRVREALRQPIAASDEAVSVTLSFGVALYPCTGGIDGLIKNADLALMQAREETGGNNCRFFEAEMDARATRRKDLLSRLRGAITRDELFLHYQPQVKTADGTIVGVEALLRWKNPELGLISPAQFIPLAEESGLIDEIGVWVLRSACRQGMAWLHAGLRPVTIAVNLSTRQFRRRDLVDQVRNALEESGLPPERLELEITEGMLMDDPDAAVATLHALHTLGPRIAIDDFGTGYSSLSYLRRFPVHVLKVDQSFVREVPDNADGSAIVAAVVSLAHSLRLGVIAEGVETQAQQAFLAGLGCDYSQGYLFAKPMAPEEVALLIGEA